MDDLFQPVHRLSLSQEARRQILERIADGRLAPQTRVSELDLSRRLGVSRTPLHEAMVSLGRDGLVVNLGRRGWLVAPVGDVEAREIYPIIGTLSALAVTLQESSIRGSVESLRALAARLDDPTLAEEDRLRLEADWHAAAANCRNEALKDMLTVLRLRAFRLELACLRQGFRPSAAELSVVVEQLARGDLRQAASALELHWRERGEAMLTWIGRSQPPEDSARIA